MYPAVARRSPPSTNVSSQSISKTSVLRQALKLYQMVDARLARGEKLFFEDERKKKAELMVL